MVDHRPRCEKTVTEITSRANRSRSRRSAIHGATGFTPTWATLRDRLLIARELLAESGSIFVQIGDEHVHRVRALMDEVFGEENFVSQIVFAKTTGFSSTNLSNVTDHLLWYARHIDHLKYRPLVYEKVAGDAGARDYRPLRDVDSKNFQFPQSRLAKPADLVSQGATAEIQTFTYRGREFDPPPGSHWKTTLLGMSRLDKASRIFLTGNTLRYLRFLDDFPSGPLHQLVVRHHLVVPRKIIRGPNDPDHCTALCLDDDRPGRSRLGPDLRLRHDRACR